MMNDALLIICTIVVIIMLHSVFIIIYGIYVLILVQTEMYSTAYEVVGPKG